MDNRWRWKKTGAIDVNLPLEEMKRKAAEKAAVESRISTLRKNIQNLMEKAGWTAGHSMDVSDVSGEDRKKPWPLIR